MKYLPIFCLFFLFACGEVATDNNNDASVTAPTPTTTTTAPNLNPSTSGEASPVAIVEEGTQYTVAFSNKLTRRDLEGIQLAVEQKGMKLTYDSLEFTPEGYLDGIGFSIDALNGTRGTGTQYNFDNTTRYGFTRDYDPSKGPLSIGDRE